MAASAGEKQNTHVLKYQSLFLYEFFENKDKEQTQKKEIATVDKYRNTKAQQHNQQETRKQKQHLNKTTDKNMGGGGTTHTRSKNICFLQAGTRFETKNILNV